MIEFAADVEQSLGESSKLTASCVVFELKAKHLYQVTGGGDGIVNSGGVGAKWGSSWGKKRVGKGVEMEAVLASEVKFALQVLLGNLEVPQGHGDVFVPQQLHESGQADAQT